jgi:hypothetical protein
LSKPKAPKPPDPYDTARADFAYNNPSQFTPYGDLINTAPTFGPGNRMISPGTSTLRLSPEVQQLFDRQLAVSGNTLDEALKRQGEFSQLNETPIPTDFSADRAHVENAMFSRARGLLDPVFADRERQIRTTMADQGLPAGGEARNYDLGQFEDSRNRAYQNAALESILAGGAEQNRLFDLTKASRNLRFNELASLLGMQQVQAPTLSSFHAPRGADFTGAQAISSNAANQAYQTQAGMFSGMMGGLFDLGSAAIGKWSDRRLKDDIRRVGTTEAGVAIYVFRYKGDPTFHMGVMADELAETQPGAVIALAGDPLRVDYGQVR